MLCALRVKRLPPLWDSMTHILVLPLAAVIYFGAIPRHAITDRMYLIYKNVSYVMYMCFVCFSDVPRSFLMADAFFIPKQNGDIILYTEQLSN